MILIVSVISVVDCSLISRILESSGRCKIGHPLKEYRNNLDLYKTREGIKTPIIFNFVRENHEFYNKQIKNYYNLIVPCRPDLIWSKLLEKYQIPVSAFCNRIRRLKEMSFNGKTMVMPFEALGSPVGLKCVQNFLGIAKPLICDWEEPKKEISCPLINKYNRDLSVMVPLSSWYLKFI